MAKKGKAKPKINKRLRGIVFDYGACGALFLILIIFVVLLAVFDSANRDLSNLIGLCVAASILGLIDIVFFVLFVKYAMVYFPLKKDIKHNSLTTKRIEIKKVKPIRQVLGKSIYCLAGLKIYSTQNNCKFYMFFDECIDFSKLKNCRRLNDMSLSIIYYEKSHYIKDCEQKEKIIKILDKCVS